MSVDSLGVLESLRCFPERLATAHEEAAHVLSHLTLPSPDDFVPMGDDLIMVDQRDRACGRRGFDDERAHPLRRSC